MTPQDGKNFNDCMEAVAFYNGASTYGRTHKHWVYVLLIDVYLSRAEVLSR